MLSLSYDRLQSHSENGDGSQEEVSEEERPSANKKRTADGKREKVNKFFKGLGDDE
jgi:hypothetical protein